MRIAKLALSVDVKAAVGGARTEREHSRHDLARLILADVTHEAWWSRPCRARMVAAVRAALVEELADGGPTDWGRVLAAARREVAAAIVAEVAADPNQARFLIERVRDWVRCDDDELTSLAAPSADDVHAMFSCHQRVHVERRITLETRLPIRQRALEVVTSAFKPLLTAVVRQHRGRMETAFRGEPALPAGTG